MEDCSAVVAYALNPFRCGSETRDMALQLIAQVPQCKARYDEAVLQRKEFERGGYDPTHMFI